MGTIFGREPVAIAAFIAIAINLGLTFGLQLTVDQVALINSLVIAGLALVVRGNVYSTQTTQAIADGATYLPAGTLVNLGQPPAGPEGP